MLMTYRCPGGLLKHFWHNSHTERFSRLKLIPQTIKATRKPKILNSILKVDQFSREEISILLPIEQVIKVGTGKCFLATGNG
jgi:hypothetical protein